MGSLIELVWRGVIAEFRYAESAACWHCQVRRQHPSPCSPFDAGTPLRHDHVTTFGYHLRQPSVFFRLFILNPPACRKPSKTPKTPHDSTFQQFNLPLTLGPNRFRSCWTVLVCF